MYCFVSLLVVLIMMLEFDHDAIWYVKIWLCIPGWSYNREWPYMRVYWFSIEQYNGWCPLKWGVIMKWMSSDSCLSGKVVCCCLYVVTLPCWPCVWNNNSIHPHYIFFKTNWCRSLKRQEHYCLPRSRFTGRNAGSSPLRKEDPV